MILVRVKGGLGNQMFQYAAGRAIALNTGLPLVLDLRHYERTREHGYAMSDFALVDDAIDTRDLPPSPKERPFAYHFSRLTKRGMQLQKEASAAFDPKIANISEPAWIEGYFQSERYFKEHSDIIRSELTLQSPPDEENAKWLKEIEAEPHAVSVHVRRGDYVRNPKFAAHHGSCTLDYYTKALAHIEAKIGAKPVLYAFSDDPDWVRTNLQLGLEMKVVGHNGSNRNIEDIRLMSACRHHIIANSSFSWWGAWLNPREDKIVVAPQQWFASAETQNPDIWADDWIRIDG